MIKQKINKGKLDAFIGMIVDKFGKNFGGSITHTKIAEKIARKYIQSCKECVNFSSIELLLWFWLYDEIENPKNDSDFRERTLGKKLIEIGFEDNVVEWVINNNMSQLVKPLHGGEKFGNIIDFEAIIALSAEGAARLVTPYFYIYWSSYVLAGYGYNFIRHHMIESLSEIWEHRILIKEIKELYRDSYTKHLNAVLDKPAIL